MSSVPYAIVNRVASSSLGLLAIQYNEGRGLTLAPFDPQNIPDNQRWVIKLGPYGTLVIPVRAADRQVVLRHGLIRTENSAQPQLWTVDGQDNDRVPVEFKLRDANDSTVWGGDPDTLMVIPQSPDINRHAQRWVLVRAWLP